MIKWEYKFTRLPFEGTDIEASVRKVEKYLNELGAEGWELAQAGEDGPYAIFKRIADVDLRGP